MRHGSHIDPPNRFQTVHQQPDYEHLQWDDELLEGGPQRPIEYIDDQSQSIISENQSPDIPFRYSLNPYRGCIHGCAYCYARPTHELLGLGAGLEFETKIIVKRQAAELFRQFLARDRWQCEPIMFSGITDCFQPAERRFRLTRGCIEVAAECRQPISIITKNALVLRDLDLLATMARESLIHVAISVTTLNRQLAADMEPRTSTPTARLKAIQKLTQAGIPVHLMLAPVIVGLNDSEIPAILEAGRQAGALTASYQLLRLPLSVLPVFEEWLRRTQSLKADAVLSQIRSTRDGRLNDATFGRRMSGQGVIADSLRNTFSVFRHKFGYQAQLPPRDITKFQPPPTKSGQLRLF
ncbi:MAG: PA0069 family radical SAM protein [Pirellulaceae bacterium]|nr:PA0069 family radical SAM protein [Pirellulaceae bacterium]